MHAEQIRNFCIAKKGVTESFPFDESTLVFKVMNKFFLLLALNKTPIQFNVKANLNRAAELREKYPNTVLPGYHMNKKHWNTIVCNNVLTQKQIFQMIDDSYNLVMASFSKKLKEELNNL